MADKTKKQMIQEKINLKTDLLQDKKKAGKDRENAMRQQVKMKKERIRQLERRVAIDAGGTPGREYQQGSFRLYNAIMKDARREAKAAEQELAAVIKENSLDVRILEQEIKQLRAEKVIYAYASERLKKLADRYVPEWEREDQYVPKMPTSRQGDVPPPEPLSDRMRTEDAQVQRLRVPDGVEVISRRMVEEFISKGGGYNLAERLENGLLSPEGDFYPVEFGGHRDFEYSVAQYNHCKRPFSILEYGWAKVSDGKWDSPRGASTTERQKAFYDLWKIVMEQFGGWNGGFEAGPYFLPLANSKFKLIRLASIVPSFLRPKQKYVPEWQREDKRKPTVMPRGIGDAPPAEPIGDRIRTEDAITKNFTVPNSMMSVDIVKLEEILSSSGTLPDMLYDGFLSPAGVFYPVNFNGHRNFDVMVCKYNNCNGPLRDYGWCSAHLGNWDFPRNSTMTSSQSMFYNLWKRLFTGTDHETLNLSNLQYNLIKISDVSLLLEKKDNFNLSRIVIDAMKKIAEENYE